MSRLRSQINKGRISSLGDVLWHSTSMSCHRRIKGGRIRIHAGWEPPRETPEDASSARTKKIGALGGSGKTTSPQQTHPSSGMVNPIHVFHNLQRCSSPLSVGRIRAGRDQSSSTTRSLISSELAFSSGAYMAQARVGRALNLPGISARMR